MRSGFPVRSRASERAHNQVRLHDGEPPHAKKLSHNEIHVNKNHGMVEFDETASNFSSADSPSRSQARNCRLGIGLATM